MRSYPMDRTISHRPSFLNYLELVRRSVYLDNRDEFVHVARKEPWRWFMLYISREKISQKSAVRNTCGELPGFMKTPKRFIVTFHNRKLSSMFVRHSTQSWIRVLSIIQYYFLQNKNYCVYQANCLLSCYTTLIII